MTESHLARVLRVEMALRGLNPQSLARAAGLKRDVVRDILRGQSENPRASTIDALARVLEIPPNALLGVEGEAGVAQAIQRVPGPDPGAAERRELLQIWDAVGHDGRRMLIFMARAIGKEAGLTVPPIPKGKIRKP